MADELVTSSDGAIVLQAFESVIRNRENGTSELSDSWHFLQLYSNWGLRLPNTEASLKTKLRIKDPLGFSFFSPMLEAYAKLHEASDHFVHKIFDRVTELGKDLQEFAESAATEAPAASNGNGHAAEKPDSIFVQIIQALDDSNMEAALEFIEDRQQRANDNYNAAVEVREQLSEYKAKLIDGNGKLDNVSQLIESDSRTSKATIAKLSGGEDILGSMANNVKLLREANERYKQDVIKATTTLTYGWVFPYGTIAAIIVAGVFGDRAVKEMKNLDELTTRMKTKSAELETAITTTQVQSIAKTGISQALALTQSAIEHTTALQNGWNELNGQLKNVKQLLDDSTRTVDEKTVLKNKVVVKSYMTKAGKTWSGMLPAINQLNANPYITVKDNEVTITQMAGDVQKEVDRLKAIELKNEEEMNKLLEEVGKEK